VRKCESQVGDSLSTYSFNSELGECDALDDLVHIFWAHTKPLVALSRNRDRLFINRMVIPLHCFLPNSMLNSGVNVGLCGTGIRVCTSFTFSNLPVVIWRSGITIRPRIDYNAVKKFFRRFQRSIMRLWIYNETSLNPDIRKNLPS
jgi:hypothetical protein